MEKLNGRMLGVGGWVCGGSWEFLVFQDPQDPQAKVSIQDMNLEQTIWVLDFQILGINMN